MAQSQSADETVNDSATSDALSADNPPAYSVTLPFTKNEGEEFFFEDIGELNKKPLYDFFKRLFDIVLSLIGMVVLAIPLAILSLLVVLTSKGSAFYTQTRLGLDGKPFRILKLRTMVDNAERDGAQWSAGDDDPRITRFGRFLRKARLDELPQLFCCFIGTMSFVGPRPERPCFYCEFEKYIHGFHQRTKVKPGITGWAQINGGYDLRPEEKIVYDIEYMKKRSLWMDFKILLGTFSIIFTHKGAK
ncbi:MAG: sugar transferase [Clostridia bacterium]|nr:sugar transferase [Clostridia bacterium]